MFLLLNFNSILVRLKQADNPNDVKKLEVFQFHSGTIKANFEKLYLEAIVEFQFHSGTIKANHYWKTKAIIY